MVGLLHRMCEGGGGVSYRPLTKTHFVSVTLPSVKFMHFTTGDVQEKNVRSVRRAEVDGSA